MDADEKKAKKPRSPAQIAAADEMKRRWNTPRRCGYCRRTLEGRCFSSRKAGYCRTCNRLYYAKPLGWAGKPSRDEAALIDPETAAPPKMRTLKETRAWMKETHVIRAQPLLYAQRDEELHRIINTIRNGGNKPAHEIPFFRQLFAEMAETQCACCKRRENLVKARGNHTFCVLCAYSITRCGICTEHYNEMFYPELASNGRVIAPDELRPPPVRREPLPPPPGATESEDDH